MLSLLVPKLGTNLALKARAPVREFPTLVVTGISYQSRPDNSGLPDAGELDFQNHLSTKRLKLISAHSSAIFAGAFTHKNERLNYIYGANATGLEAALRSFYQTECPTRQAYINVKSDPHWEAYLHFLYPNAQTIAHYQTELIQLGALKPQRPQGHPGTPSNGSGLSCLLLYQRDSDRDRG